MDALLISNATGWFIRLAILLPVLCGEGELAWAARGGELTLRIVDAETERPIAARMHLKTTRGKSIRPPKVPYWHDHFVVDGQITLELSRGQYVFDLECGLEYKTRQGHFRIDRDAQDEKVIVMHRFANLASEGWYAADLHVERKSKLQRSSPFLDQLLRAEGLHVLPMVTWSNVRGKSLRRLPTSEAEMASAGGRFYSLTAGRDARKGGALLFFRLQSPLDLSQAADAYPPSSQSLVMAKQQAAAHVAAEAPFWWDFPVWLASRRLDSVVIAGSHLQRDGVQDDEAWGRARNRLLFPPPHGNGRWAEVIYYRVLESGLRIPPSAASGSGVAPNPVGYNRVYVHCGSQLTYDQFWKNLAQGKVFVTNGPLLRTTVEGKIPGHVFPATAGQQRNFQIGLTLSTREPIDYLEIVKNGEPIHQVRLAELAKAGGRLPEVTFEQSGWFLVRAVTNAQQTYRYATTGPYYVEFDGRPRISRQAAEFFLDWTEQQAQQTQLADDQQQRDAMRYLRSARTFWQQRLEQATAP